MGFFNKSEVQKLLADINSSNESRKEYLRTSDMQLYDALMSNDLETLNTYDFERVDKFYQQLKVDTDYDEEEMERLGQEAISAAKQRDDERGVSTRERWERFIADIKELPEEAKYMWMFDFETIRDKVDAGDVDALMSCDLHEMYVARNILDILNTKRTMAVLESAPAEDKKQVATEYTLTSSSPLYDKVKAFHESLGQGWFLLKEAGGATVSNACMNGEPKALEGYTDAQIDSYIEWAKTKALEEAADLNQSTDDYKVAANIIGTQDKKHLANKLRVLYGKLDNTSKGIFAKYDSEVTNKIVAEDIVWLSNRDIAVIHDNYAILRRLVELM